MDPEVSEISDGSLDSLLASTPYEMEPLVTVPSYVAEPKDESTQGTDAEGSSLAGIASTETEVTTSAEQAVTSQAPQYVAPIAAPVAPDPEAAQLRQQLAQFQQRTEFAESQARASREAEQNRAFESSIADLDPAEQNFARAKRQNDTLILHNRYLLQERNRNAERTKLQEQQVQRTEQARQESSSKNTLVALLAEEHGIQDEPGLMALLRTQSYQEMLKTAEYLGRHEQSATASLVQSSGTNRIVDHPGLDNGNGAGYAPPKPGSGDLDSLLKMTSYEVNPF